MRLHQLLPHLDAVAPLARAEPWDNVGLLVGDANTEVTRLLLTVDATQAVMAEAQAQGAQLLVSYHPLLIKPVRKLAPSDLLTLACRQNLAVYSPHTALDAAAGGTNDVLADLAGLGARMPLAPSRGPKDLQAPSVGQGRVGELAQRQAATLGVLAERLRLGAGLAFVQVAQAQGTAGQTLRRVACAAGAGDDLVPLAQAAGAQALVTGELRHHTLLACLATGLSVILLGHDGSERPALAGLQRQLAARLQGVQIACSQADRSALQLVQAGA